MTDDSRRTAWLLGVLFGIVGMGSSSAALALPAMADHLEISDGLSAWAISLYVLMLAVATAVYGRVADLVGVRLPLLVGIGLMTAGALVAAFAPSYGLVLLGRAVQGAGAAAVPTLGATILTTRYDGPVRALALGRLAGVTAAISCLGPLAGGLVEGTLGWRAALALPIVSVLVLPFLWSALGNVGTGARLDVPGALLVAATASGVVLLVQSPSTGIEVALAGLALVLVGVPAITTWVRRQPHGFLPLEVIGNQAVVRSALAAAAIPAGWFAMLVAVPLVLDHRGWEAWQIGLLLVPSAAFGLVTPRFAGPFLARVGPARTLATAALLATTALAVGATGARTGLAPLLLLGVILVTISFGLGQPALSAAVGTAVRDHVRGVALGIATLFFLVGGSVGSAVVGGLGGDLGLDGAMLVLGALPLLGLAALLPALRRPH